MQSKRWLTSREHASDAAWPDRPDSRARKSTVVPNGAVEASSGRASRSSAGAASRARSTAMRAVAVVAKAPSWIDQAPRAAGETAGTQRRDGSGTNPGGQPGDAWGAAKGGSEAATVWIGLRSGGAQAGPGVAAGAGSDVVSTAPWARGAQGRPGS